MDERIERAGDVYVRAVFAGDTSGLAGAERELDAVEADLALARGRIMHGRFLTDHVEDPAELGLFERAAGLFRRLGDVRGEGEALFWIGIVHQVIRDDNDTAAPFFEQARALAGQAGDKLTLSYALRHLGFVDHLAGRLEPARERLEESTRLRRELGFGAGVAANLVGLIYIAAAQGRHDDALALADEASALAAAAGADVITSQVEEARAALTG